MKITFTRHAKNRMRWRGITLQEAMQAIENADRKELLEHNKFHYFKNTNNKYIRATIVFEDNKIIVISVVDKNN